MKHRPVSLWTTSIIVPPHNTLKALALRNTDNINPIALLKNINPNGLSDGHFTRLGKLP